jgi:hypothetical protein
MSSKYLLIITGIFLFCAERFRLGKTWSEYDTTLEVIQQHTTDIQPNLHRRMEGGGHEFETQMAALIGLRGLQRGQSFELFFNRDDVGNIDDFVYTADGWRYFLQMKHGDSQIKKKLTVADLVTLLQICFESYCDIKQGKKFRDIPVDKTEFIIYTNRTLDPKLSQHTRKQREGDVFFKTRDKEIFIFIPCSNTKTNLHALLENSVRGNKQIHGPSYRKTISEFFNRVIMVASVNGKCQLDDEIRKEIEQHDVTKVDCETYNAELLYLKTQVENWLKNRREGMTAEMFRNWLQEAKTEVCRLFVSSLFVSCMEELVMTGINFAGSEFSRLQAELFNKPAVHLRSDSPALCSILLLDCLDTSKCIFVNFKSLQSNKNKLLRAWLGGDWQWCVVVCDSGSLGIHVSEECLNLLRMKLVASNKYLIILTAHSAQQIQGFSPIDYKFEFKHLSTESQEMFLDKEVEFQGHKLSVKCILHRHGIVEHTLGADIVKELVTKGNVQLGGTLPTNSGYYEPRVLEREVCLHLDVLRNQDSYPDMFAVSGMEVKALAAVVPAGETVQYIDQQNMHHTHFTHDRCSRFIALPEGDAEIWFLEICQKHRERTLHWVQFNNGTLRWKKTHGDPDKLLNYIDTKKTRLGRKCTEKYIARRTCEVGEDSIWDLGERAVLVVAKKGMGKSRTTAQVAWSTKERDPTSWVVHIDWNVHGTNLQKLNTKKFNLDSLVNFFCSVAFPDSEFTDINRRLLKQALQNSGNVTVLMDGFDKIRPIHMYKAAIILFVLMTSEVKGVWVTSRAVQKQWLVKVLSVGAFIMKELSHQSQVTIFQKLLTSKEIRNKQKLAASLSQLIMRENYLVNNSKFNGTPLYIKMIASAFELDTYTWQRKGFFGLSGENDPVCFYDSFLETLLSIYLAKPERVDITNDSVLGSHKRLKDSFLEDFEKCALVATMPPSMLKSLHNSITEEETQPFLVKLLTAKDPRLIRVVMNVVDGKLQLVHSSFTEFLTSRWFSKYFELNRSVMEDILFDRRYSFVRDMFDRMLAKDCPLHCAVLERDEESFENLLDGCDVSAVDKGGRTVVHIIATRDCTFLDIINRVFPDEASLYNKDCVLQWTPLQYAVKSENWLIVERLLERNVDRSGLDMIRQRAQDTDYVDPIIIHAATYGHLLLLEMLYRVGVNIYQASSTDFPSPLHAAIQAQQLQVTRWLIQHGADCNTRYSDGQTPLFHAVTEGSLDVVRALVEEGGASVDIRDNDGRTVIDWTNVYASDPKNLDDIVWKGDVERLVEIVKFLQEGNVVSSAVCG